jgi:hypothetical protein
MKVQDALEKNGKAYRVISSTSEPYAYIDGLYLVWEDGVKVGYEGIIAEDWLPYPEEKEIRPEKAGEVWQYEEDSHKKVTVWHKGILCFHALSRRDRPDIIYFKKDDGLGWFCCDEPVHGKNGWTRLYPPVEDESVERIEIEGVENFRLCGDTFESSIYKVDIPDGYLDRLEDKPPMKMILEIPKDKNDLPKA